MKTITVTNLNDSGTGSLHQAITDAQNYTSTEEVEIVFAESLAGTITLGSNLKIPAKVTVQLPELVKLNLNSRDLLIYGNLTAENESAVDSIFSTSTSAQVMVYSGGKMSLTKANIALTTSSSSSADDLSIHEGGVVELSECEIAGRVANVGDLKANNCTFKGSVTNKGALQADNCTFRTSIILNSSTWSMGGSGNEFTWGVFTLQTGFGGDTSFMKTFVKTAPEDAYVGMLGSMYDCTLADIRSVIPGGYKFIGTTEIQSGYTVTLEEGVRLNLGSYDLSVRGNFIADNQSPVDSIFSTSTSAQVIVYSGGKMSLTKANIALPASQSVQINEGGTVELAECDIDGDVKNAGDLKANNCTFKSYVTNNGSLQADNSTFHSPIIFNSSTWSMGGSGNEFTQPEAFRLQTGFGGDTSFMKTFVKTAPEDAYVSMPSEIYSCTLADIRSVLSGGYKFIGTTEIRSGYTMTLLEGALIDDNGEYFNIYGTLKAEYENVTDAIICSRYIKVDNGGKVILKNANVVDCNGDRALIEVQDAASSWTMEGGSLVGEIRAFFGATITLTDVTSAQGGISCREDSYINLDGVTSKSGIDNSGTMTIKNTCTESRISLYEASSTALENVTCESLYIGEIWNISTGGTGVTITGQCALQLGYLTGDLLTSFEWNATAEDAYVYITGVMEDCILADISSKCAGGYWISGSVYGNVEVESGVSIEKLSYLNVYGTFKVENQTVQDAINPEDRMGNVTIYADGRVILKNSNVSLNSIDVYSGGVFDMTGGTLNAPLEVSEGAEAYLDSVQCKLPVIVAGSLTADSCVFEAAMSLHSGASLSGSGNIFVNEEIFKLKEANGDVSTTVAQLKDSRYAKDNPYVSIVSFAGECNVTLKALSGELKKYVIQKDSDYYYSDIPHIDASGVLNIDSSAVVEAIEMECEGTINCAVGAVFDTSGLILKGTLNCDRRLFDGLLTLGAGALLCGNGNTIAADMRFVLSDWSGEVADAFAGLSGTVLEDGMPAIHVQSISGAAILGHINNQDTTYVLETSDLEADLVVQDGVTLRCAVDDTYVYGNLALSGAVKLETSEGRVTDYYDGGGSTRRGLYISAGATLRYDTLAVDGTLILNEGAAVSGSNLVLMGKESLGIVVTDWDGSAPAVMVNLGKVETTRDDARLFYRIDGLGGNSVTISKKSQQSLTGDIFESVLFDEVVLYEGDILTIGADAPVTVGTLLQVQEGATLNLQSGARLKVEQESQSSDDYYYEGSGTVVGIQVCENSTVNLGGKVYIDGDVHIWPGAEINGGELVLMGDSRIVLHDWSGSTATLDSMVSGKISYENSTPNPVEISFGYSEGGSVTLAELKNGQSDYYFGNGYAYGTSLTLEEGVSLHLDEYIDLYTYGEEDTTPTLTMKKGSSISGSRENAELRLNQGLSGIDCTINATLCLDGILSGRGIKLTAERAVEFYYHVEGEETYRSVYSFEEMFGNADYECTHENAYAVCRLSDSYGTAPIYNIDAAFMAAHTPVGCKQLVFSGYNSQSLFKIDSGITFGVEELTLHDDSRIEFGKDCVVVGYDRNEESYLEVLHNSEIVADNTTFQVTLEIDGTTLLQGSGYRFAAKNAVNYWCDMSLQSLADVKHVLDGVDYTVLRDDAIFGLSLYLAGEDDFYLTQKDLDALTPTGFAGGALGSLDFWQFEGKDVVLDGVTILPCSMIGNGNSSLETLKILNTTLHSDVHISGWGMNNLILDNVQLKGAEIDITADNTVISNCSGTGVLTIAGSVTVRNCDLSQIEVLFSEWIESTGTVDLSGNYWGTTDIEAIRSRFESVPSALNVVIGDVLAEPPAGIAFTFAASIASGLKLEPSERTLTLLFTAQIDADSVGMGSVVLRDAAGRVMEIDSILVKGDRLVLNLTEPFEAGEYKVSVNAGLKDTDGNAFVAPVVNPELKVTVEKDSQVRVLKTLFNESVGSLDSVDIYLSGSSVVDPELLVEAVSLVAEDGTVYDAVRVETVIDGLLYRAIFDGKQPAGQYDFVIKDDVAITSRGDKLGSSFQQTLYISSPDLEVVSQHLQLFARANEQDKQMKVTYQVVNNGEAIKFRDRVDTLFVCETAEWDASAARAVSRNQVDSTCLAGGQVEYSFSYDLDDCTIGKKFYLFVRTDSREDVAETDEQNNISCIGEITIVPDEWNIRGTELNLETGSTAYYEWVAEADGSYLLGVTSADCRVQASGAEWDGLYGSPSAALLLESEGKQYWYLNVRAGQTYQLAMTALQEIKDLTCVTVAAPACVQSLYSPYVDPINNCIVVRGTNLQQLDDFRLVHQDGQEIHATEINVIDAGTLEVRFDLESAQMQIGEEYYLTWENESGTVNTLQQAIQYASPLLASKFVQPTIGVIREGSCFHLQVRTENTAGGAAKAPLVLVREGVEKEILYYGEVKSVHAAKLQGRKALLFLADSADDTPGYLKSGEGYTFTFTERVAIDNPATYTEAWTYDDEREMTPQMWEWVESALRPENVQATAWNAWWQDMQPRIGDRVCDVVNFVSLLRDTLAAGFDYQATLPEMIGKAITSEAELAPAYSVSGIMKGSGSSDVYADKVVYLYQLVNGEWVLIDTTNTDEFGNYTLYGTRSGQSYAIGSDQALASGGDGKAADLVELPGVVGDLKKDILVYEPSGSLLPVGDTDFRYLNTPDGRRHRVWVHNGTLQYALWEDDAWGTSVKLADNVTSNYELLWSEKDDCMVVLFDAGTEEEPDYGMVMFKWALHGLAVSDVLYLSSIYGQKDTMVTYTVDDSRGVLIYSSGSEQSDLTVYAVTPDFEDDEVSLQRYALRSLTGGSFTGSYELKLSDNIKVVLSGTVSAQYETDCKFVYSGTLGVSVEVEAGAWMVGVSSGAMNLSYNFEKEKNNIEKTWDFSIDSISLSVLNKEALIYVLGGVAGVLAGIATGGAAIYPAVQGTITALKTLRESLESVGIELTLGVQLDLVWGNIIGSSEEGLTYVGQDVFRLGAVVGVSTEKKLGKGADDKFTASIQGGLWVELSGNLYTTPKKVVKDQSLYADISFNLEWNWKGYGAEIAATIKNERGNGPLQFDYSIKFNKAASAGRVLLTSGTGFAYDESSSVVLDNEVVTLNIGSTDGVSTFLYTVHSAQTGTLEQEDLMFNFAIDGSAALDTSFGVYAENVESQALISGSALFVFDMQAAVTEVNGEYDTESFNELLATLDSGKIISSALYKNGQMRNVDDSALSEASSGVLSKAIYEDENGTVYLAWIRSLDGLYEVYVSTLAQESAAWSEPVAVFASERCIDDIQLFSTSQGLGYSFEAEDLESDALIDGEIQTYQGYCREGNWSEPVNALTGESFATEQSMEALVARYANRMAAFTSRSSGASGDMSWWESLVKRALNVVTPDFPDCEDDDDDPKKDKFPKEAKKSKDPNDITGPAGVGEQNWVADGVQTYLIQCENYAEKSFAHAARVVITQQLDADLDWSTFTIGAMNMGGYDIEVPEGMSQYRARLDWRETHGLYVDVEVSLDYATGVVTWSFTGIDPETEDIPVSSDMGLLAPNVNPPEGDGWVQYSIKPKEGAATGAKVDSQATIVFDWNDPIDTPHIFNTLDKTAPTSAMQPNTRRIDAHHYALSWLGEDAHSGVGSYDVYVSCDGGEWELWADGITATTAVYTAEQGAHEYRFCVVAKDNVGNVQTEAGDALKLSHDSSKGAPEVMALAATTDPATGFVTGFTATFNVSMNLATQLKDGSLASLVTLVHTQAGAVNMSDGAFSYDSVTKTLTWKSNTPLRAGEYRLTVQPGALKSSSGVALGAPVIPGFSVRHLMQTVGSYSAPTVADVNGDGLVDLLIGEKTSDDSGSVRLHINVGTAEQPEFGAGQYISTPQGLLTVEATGCLGAAPAVADINGDGLADLLIGKADGTIQLYIQEQPGAEGDGPLWSDYGRIKGIDVGERATPVQADWNSDGRPDLLVGNADGNIVLFLNIGTTEVPAYDSGRYLYDGGSLLSVPEGRSAFVVGDWDGDSLPDIISGNTAGQLVYYHNYGTEGNPLFAGYELLHADGGIFDLPNSPRSRLAAMDWNGDGVLDLVVGAEDGNLHLLSGEKNSAGVVGGLGVEGHPNLDDMPSGSQVLQLSSAYDGSGIYSATVQDNLSCTDRTDYFSLHATADGAFNMALDTSKLDAAVRLSVGVLDGDGLFSVSQELLLTPGAAADSLPGVAISAGEQLYIRVESVDVSSETNYELSLTGTVPSVGSNLATQNNSAAEATELSSPSAAVTGWVGAGDACDFYRVEMGSEGSLNLQLGELDAAARLRVYRDCGEYGLSLQSSQVVKAAGSVDTTLSLTSGTYFVEIASMDSGAGRYNTGYSLCLNREEQESRRVEDDRSNVTIG